MLSALISNDENKTKNKRKVMNDKFDELAKALAQSVTRRGALKKFGVGFVGTALASLGLAPRAGAGPGGCNCKNQVTYGCEKRYPVGSQGYFDCISNCRGSCAGKGGPY
jgi:hypothetical protein